MEINKLKAALYVRVSTTEQANEGYSISAQTEKLTNYAKAKDYQIVKTYTDPGISGAKLDRPALQNMITDIEKGMIDIVLVYKLDRLSRSQKNTLYLIEDVFLKNKVDFISMNESFDTSTSFGRAMIGILSVFAQLERDAITERTRMGKIERAKEGKWQGGGNFAPFGYRYENDILKVNEFEKIIVQEMFDLYLEGYGTNKIAEILGTKYPGKVKSPNLVKGVLRNKIYIGKINFAGEIYDGLHETFIDKKIFQNVQEIYGKRANKTYKGDYNQKGLLLGKIYCAKCGAKYYRQVTGSVKYRYVKYACYSQNRSLSSKTMVKDRNCVNKRYNAEELEQSTIDKINKLTVAELTSTTNLKLLDNRKTIEKEIKNLESQINKLIDLFQLGNISTELLSSRIDNLNIQKNNLEIELSKLKKVKTKKEIESKLQTLKDFDWDTETTINKIKMIDEFIDKITINDDEVLIHWRL
ncbi:recombinase family protein [Carnobacterium divergens]|uniref:recombinase family protein n=1 Tax=Carnobacterium divergens TaxID=2748 RepID=UPI0007F3AFB2|nr:recombinase family protein [Carnobacterium divergens]MDT1995653.1 recombinase family protein [Carnobacterium divergens]SBO18189.1 Resolvase protein [Carnobacterium divergens]